MNFAMISIIDQWQVEGFDATNKGSQLFNYLKNKTKNSGIVKANYIPCITPVGHATISTGENPVVHGIVGRRWCTRENIALEEIDIDDVYKYFVKGGPRFSFSEYIKNNNLCKKLEDWFSIVVAAKEFIPFLVGGESADIQIYPRYGHDGWGINIRCSNKNYVNNNEKQKIINEINKVSSVSGSYGGLIPSRKYHIHRFLLHNFSFPPNDVVKLDGFYSECVKLFAQKSYDFGNKDTFIFQSFFSSDWIGHEEGPSSQRYRDTLNDIYDMIYDQICFHKGLLENDRLVGLITSDHGARDVSNLIFLNSKNAPNNEYIEISPAKTEGVGDAISASPYASATDIAYWYEEPSLKDHLNRRSYDKNDYGRFLPADIKNILAESYNADNIPDVIEIPTCQKYILDKDWGVLWKGSHGASVVDENDLTDINQEDCRIPYVLFTLDSKEKDKNNSVSSLIPSLQKDLRGMFIDQLDKPRGKVMAVLPEKNESNENCPVDDVHSLSGLSYQCMLISDAYHLLSKLIMSGEIGKHILLGIIKNIFNEMEEKKLSLSTILILLMVKSNKFELRASTIGEIINSPEIFESRLTDRQRRLKESIKSYEDIYQISRFYEKLGSDLKRFGAGSPRLLIAEYMRKFSNSLKNLAIQFEKCLS